MKQLDPQSAQNLLLLHAPNIKSKLKEIAELCEFNPLTLCLAGAMLGNVKSFTDQSLFEKLQQWAEGNLLMELIEQTYKELDDGASKVLRKLSVFPGTFDAKAEDFICQDKDNIHLSKLVDRQLVIFNESRWCYQLRPVIQKFLRDKITESETADAEKRHATHFMIRLQGLQSSLAENSSSSTHTSVNAFDADWENYQAAQEWSLDKLGTSNENSQLCASFPENGAQFLKWRLSPKKSMQWFDAGLAATQELKDGRGELRQMVNLSEDTFESRDYSKAKDLHEDTLEMAMELGEDTCATMILDKLAFFQTALNRHRGAIEYHEQALEIFKKNDDIEGQVTIAIKIAAIYGKINSPSDSINYLKQALDLAEKSGLHEEQRKILSDLGKVSYQSREYRQAIEYFEKARVLDQRFNDLYGEACDLWGISLSNEKLHSMGEAIKKGEAAFKLFRVEKKKETKMVQQKLKSWKPPQRAAGPN